jgi:N-formylglutamate deformylase
MRKTAAAGTGGQAIGRARSATLPAVTTQGASFVVHEPTAAPIAIVVDSPHSGMEWPADFHPAAPREAILTTWDAFVDQLWSGALSAGATLITACFPRAYIDVNRAADDIDPELVDGEWPTPLTVSDYSRRGMGLIRRQALPGVPMYDGPLSVVAIQARIDLWYRPYRAALAYALDRAHAHFGTVVHVNAHSMKSRANAMNIDSGAVRPDIVVSDRHGTTADAALTSWVADWFRAQGYTTQVNVPYQGGDLVAHFGAPASGRHSVQIELNRGLYMHESTFERSAGFDPLQRALTTFVHDLGHRLHGGQDSQERA